MEQVKTVNNNSQNMYEKPQMNTVRGTVNHYNHIILTAFV